MLTFARPRSPAAPLLRSLQSSQAWFVRCIKSNPELLPRKMHGESVITQLRMSGTLDAVKLIQVRATDDRRLTTDY